MFCGKVNIESKKKRQELDWTTICTISSRQELEKEIRILSFLFDSMLSILLMCQCYPEKSNDINIIVPKMACVK